MMQTDVKNKRLTATGQLGVGRTRIKALQVQSANDVTITVRDGSSTGLILMQVDYTPITNTGASCYFLFPGEGVLSQNDPQINISTAVAVSVFYG